MSDGSIKHPLTQTLTIPIYKNGCPALSRDEATSDNTIQILIITLKRVFETSFKAEKKKKH